MSLPVTDAKYQRAPTSDDRGKADLMEAQLITAGDDLMGKLRLLVEADPA
jgi:hypothetical protein